MPQSYRSNCWLGWRARNEEPAGYIQQLHASCIKEQPLKWRGKCFSVPKFPMLYNRSDCLWMPWKLARPSSNLQAVWESGLLQRLSVPLKPHQSDSNFYVSHIFLQTLHGLFLRASQPLDRLHNKLGERRLKLTSRCIYTYASEQQKFLVSNWWGIPPYCWQDQ